jgi:signal transduction histidine kinase
LTVILANTDIVLSSRDKTVAQQQKWIDYIKIEAQRMTSLVNNLLFLAKADDSVDKVILSDINLSDTVWSCILPFESVAFENGKTIDSQIENNVIVKGDEGKLKQLIGILVDNAIKYSSEKGIITVSLSRSQDKIKLSVSNNGEPIPEDQLGHIFERFYRVDKSRAREKGGYGLGLSIAKNIIEMHNGLIKVESTKGKGTKFTIFFRLFKEGRG